MGRDVGAVIDPHLFFVFWPFRHWWVRSVPRLEEAAAGQQEMRAVVSDALRVFHDTHLLGKADPSRWGRWADAAGIAKKGLAPASSTCKRVFVH